MSSEFRPETIAYLQKTAISYRKRHGQYFTPASIREQLLKQLPKLVHPKILDPACGTGEFLLSVSEKYPNAEVFGWDIDKNVIKIAKQLVPDALIQPCNSLTYKTSEQFDVVIGNPPYYEFKPDETLRNSYAEVLKGRPNIFAMFVKRGLDLLRPDGYLAYVIPPSMNNGAYFSKLREYIITHADISYLKILQSPHLFDQAQQTVMLLILQKKKNKGKFLFKKNGIMLFSENPNRLKKAFTGKSTFAELGFTVATGKIVWNKNKALLSNNQNDGVLLVWSHNIKNGRLQLSTKAGKPQYISTANYDIGPAIVVNRITGSTGKTSLKTAVIPSGTCFLAENHVNVIMPSEKISVKKLQQYADWISSDQTAQTMRLITGNTQISKTELAYLLPVEP